MEPDSLTTPSLGGGKSKEKERDIGWKYGTADPSGKDAVKCHFCMKTYNGGITRHKWHLVGGNKNVVVCRKCPEHVKEEVSEFMKRKVEAKLAANQVRDFDVITVHDDECDDEENVPQSVPAPKGPLDLYYKREASNKKRKGARGVDVDKCRKELRDHAVQMFARWMYDAGIAFNAVNYESLQKAIDDIGQYGPQMKAPTMHEVRVTSLKKEKEHTKKLVEENMEEARKNGCTLMADGWTDKNGRVLVNFLVNTPKGSVFLDTVDACEYSKTGAKMCDLLSKYINQIGPENVVQIVTDNASENKLAGTMLEACYPHLFWTPCATHCLDLMFEDIFKIPRFKNTIEKAIRVNGYIYSRTRVLSLMRKFTNNKEMVRPAKSRFATGFLTLKRFQEEKRNLLRFFASEEWHESKFSKEMVGKKIHKLLGETFWRNTTDILKIGGPLLTVLRMVDGERKPAMGYIYEAMDKAKEAIAKAFSLNEAKYKPIFEIIDKRWDNHLHRPLHAAGYYLNPSLFYKNQDVQSDVEIISGFQRCLSKMILNEEVEDKIARELVAYRNAEGTFGLPAAIRNRDKQQTLAEWWVNYGASTPNLQKFAIRIPSLVCSSSGCERNWSFFEHIHSKKRNRLAQRRLNDLVYIKYNRALKRRYRLSGTVDPIALDAIDDANEWLTGVPERSSFDSNVVIDGDDDDYDKDLAGIDVGVDEADEVDYNLRARNPSSSYARTTGARSSSAAHSKKKTLVDEDTKEEEEVTPIWDTNLQNEEDNNFEDDHLDDDEY